MKHGAQKKVRNRINYLIGFGISIFAIIWIMQSVEGDEVFARVKEVRPSLLLAAVATTLLSYVLRSWRWRYFFLESGPALHESFRCLIVGFFMNNVLPARMGELVRAHIGSRAFGKSRTVVLATVAAERLVDGVVISALFAILFSLGASAAEIQNGREIYYVAYLFGIAAAGTAVILLVRNMLFDLIEKVNGVFPGHLSTYTLVRIRRFIEGLEPLQRWRKLSVILTLSIAIWLTELFVYQLVSLAFNQHLTIGALSLFLAAVNFSSLIPAAPAGIGVIEMFTTAALVRIGVDRESALAMVAAQHIIQFGVVGVPGLFFFLTTLHGKLPEGEESVDGDVLL
jgi:glycosyltransferase 2 family protein